MATRVAIYVRVSTIYQTDRDSLPMQKQDLINYSRFVLNSEDYQIYEDAGYSGKNTQRPKFKQMMADVRAGLFSHVLVWKIDRISRNLLDFASMYTELKSLGVTFISKNEQFDTSTAMGEAMLKIILVFAELERNITSERVTATMLSRANNGQWNGGRVPYGYTYDKNSQSFAVDIDEAEIVKIIHDKYESMHSLLNVTRYLNDNNYRNRSGSIWNAVSVRLILISSFYAGDYSYNHAKDGQRNRKKDESEWITIKDHHPAIVTREQKEHVINMLTNRRPTLAYQRGDSVHIFKGLILCGYCGKMFGSYSAASTKSLKYSNYRCPTSRYSKNLCNAIGVSDMYVGEFMLNYILNMLNAQTNFDNINTLWDLQQQLLSGACFSQIGRIDEDGLRDFFNVLATTEKGKNIYGKRAKTKKTMPSNLSRLRAERAKLERALERLMNIYLYDKNGISEEEFLSQRNTISEKLAAVNEEIGLTNGEDNDSLTDADFVARASEFILAQELKGRNYISFRRLLRTIDHGVIKEFMVSVIDNIILDGGKIKQVTFRNGVTHKFIYR